MRRSRKRPLRSGHMDTRVTLYKQDPTQVADTDGTFPEDAKPVGKRWAEIVPLRGRLQEFTTSREPTVTHVVRVRYDDTTASLTPNNWIVVDASAARLNIVAAIDLDNRHSIMELECMERR